MATEGGSYRKRAEQAVNEQLMERLRDSVGDGLASQLARGAAHYATQYQLGDPSVRKDGFIREQLKKTDGALREFAVKYPNKERQLRNLRAEWRETTAELPKRRRLEQEDSEREIGPDVTEAGARLLKGAAAANRKVIASMESRLGSLPERGEALKNEMADLAKRAEWRLAVIRESAVRDEAKKLEAQDLAQARAQEQSRTRAPVAPAPPPAVEVGPGM